MGKDLHHHFSVARQTFEECDAALGNKLSDIVFNGPQAYSRVGHHKG
jgi:hypothetical protein